MLRSHADHPENREPEPTPTPTGNAQPPPELLPMLTDGPWCPDYIPLTGMVQMGAVALWHGAPGSGKSLLAINAMAALLTHDGERLLGRKVLEKPVPAPEMTTKRVEHRCLYVSLEDTRNQVDGRVRAITSHYCLDAAIWERARMICHIVANPGQKAGAIEAAMKELKPTVVIIDNLRRFDADAESEAAKAQPVMESVERLARDHGAAVVLIHHDRKMPGQGGGATKGDEMASGSGALIGASRLAVQIHKDAEDIVWLNGGKSNHGPNAGNSSFDLVQETVCGYNVVVASPRPDTSPENAFEGMAPEKRREIARELLGRDDDQRMANVSSRGWAGYALGESLGMDPEADMGRGTKNAKQRNAEQKAARLKVTAMLDYLVRAGVLVIRKTKIQRENRSTRESEVYCQGSKGVSDA